MPTKRKTLEELIVDLVVCRENRRAAKADYREIQHIPGTETGRAYRMFILRSGQAGAALRAILKRGAELRQVDRAAELNEK